MAFCGLKIGAAAIVAVGALVVNTGLARDGGGAFAGAAAQAASADVSIVRDIAYGADEKQKLDIFAPPAGAAPRTVVIFVHGGSFQGSDKDNYNNIMAWTAQNGMVGVNMNFRLFPEVTFPAQEEDIASVVEWTKANIAEYGGDPNRIFLFGHSSGGGNIANYASMPQFQRDPAIKGLILLSSVMDLTIYPEPFGYFGTTDPDRLRELSPITNLVQIDLPILMGLGDQDSPTITPSVPAARDTLCAAGKCPRFTRTVGTHGGVAQAIGAEGDQTFANAALAFINETP